MAEKTEQPTDKKVRDSAKKGQSFKGKDLIAAAVLVCGALAISGFSSLTGLGHLLQKVLLSPSEIKISAYLDELYRLFLYAVIPVLLCCLLPGMLLSLLQSRFRLATEALKINFSHLNPISGFKKIFGIRPLKELVKAVLYLLAFGTSIYIFILLWRREVFMLYHAGLEEMITQWGRLCIIFIFVFLASSLILLLLDTLAELFLFIKDLKMEKQEVKKEYKENEGDPQIKQARKEIHREILSEETKNGIKNSQVVMANPTHIALGIYFDPSVAELPLIIVKAQNAQARAVIAYAEEQGIPVVRDIPLARRLYRNNSIFSFIRDDDLLDIMNILIWLKRIELEKLGISLPSAVESINQELEATAIDVKDENSADSQPSHSEPLEKKSD
ncbi:surface presentation of antigens protein spaS [Yersinia ruckeri]|uniref:EscU/YscU/HrcU family type III secretion system export apparatus switch protein n=1 Tax=Yersinia ruckeri TaxID=29486 RepID=UPI0005AC1078|nr:EscU/YscU/HrcU family type III secretion system export apparatus switch protein [Yersinia ruckeri]AJI95342.1 surface presentation of antigens protein spaS [Yersinia ruckeri]MCW6566894.1 EscU/YscU/HrcU family type III secretion system export apparatus switch protein [Yersinia ruckeri]